jgi:hypothetical protein
LLQERPLNKTEEQDKDVQEMVDMYGKKADGSKKSDTFFEELWAS